MIIGRTCITCDYLIEGRFSLWCRSKSKHLFRHTLERSEVDQPGAVCASCLQQLLFRHGEFRSLDELSPSSRMASRTEVIALFRYEGAVKKIVGEIKHNQNMRLFDQMAALLAQLVDIPESPVNSSEEQAGGNELVTWVPASRRGKSARGYDQGQLLAESLAKRLGISAVPLLSRAGIYEQKALSLSERKSGPEISLRAKANRIGLKRRILLIDDVVTSGSTLKKATSLLRTLHTRQVTAVCLAQVESRF